jgi:hypothetical protein
MDPQLYLEFETNLEVAAFEEWLGREWARQWLSECIASNWVDKAYAQAHYANTGEFYPIPPDYLAPGIPDPPPPDVWTWYYSRAKPLPGSGGVFVLYDHIMSFTGIVNLHTLSTGQTYSIDIAANAKTYEQLSVAAQTVLAG